MEMDRALRLLEENDTVLDQVEKSLEQFDLKAIRAQGNRIEKAFGRFNTLTEKLRVIKHTFLHVLYHLSRDCGTLEYKVGKRIYTFHRNLQEIYVLDGPASMREGFTLEQFVKCEFWSYELLQAIVRKIVVELSGLPTKQRALQGEVLKLTKISEEFSKLSS